jgi:hypothetical protein
MTDVQLLGECSLYVDLQPETAAPIGGDWIVTEAGSRYLVLTSRLVPSRKHDQRRRYALRCGRLAKHLEVPEDVRAIVLRWYPRSPRKTH